MECPRYWNQQSTGARRDSKRKIAELMANIARSLANLGRHKDAALTGI
jgi:hypothetical protein